MPIVIAVLQNIRYALLISGECNVQEDLSVIIQSVTMPSVTALLQNIRVTLLISCA
jgi:hypothetical protein